MATHVNFEGARPHKTLTAVFTFKWSFTCVPPEVIREMAMGCKHSSTTLKVTSKRFLTVMNPYVRLQVTFLRKSLTTGWKVAHEWLLSHL